MKIPGFMIWHVIIFGLLTICLIALVICGIILFHPVLMLEMIIGSLGLFATGVAGIYDWKKTFEKSDIKKNSI